MEFNDDSSQVGGARVCVADADVGSLSDAELVERMAELGRERSRVEGQLAVAAAEMHRRVGGRAAAATVREQLKVSARQATADTELAASLADEFPATLAALISDHLGPCPGNRQGRSGPRPRQRARPVGDGPRRAR